MKYFGMIALLIVIGLGVWWTVKNLPTETGGGNSTYQEAIDGAKSAAQKINDQANMKPVSQTESESTKISIYDGVEVASNSVIIDLGKKGLTGSLKAEVRLLPNLKELYLNDNDFTGLPAELGQLSKLEVLNLANNRQLTGLPQELGNLKHLRILDLRGTSFSKTDLDIIKKGLPETAVVYERY
jgi:Leucine-rich repeat (LRR) protein